MEKQHFFTLLNKWSRIRFTDVFLVKPMVFELTSPRFELYVRDQSDPPSWLLIRNFSTNENRELLLARYSRWLDEFHHPSVIEDHSRLHEPLINETPFTESWLPLSNIDSKSKAVMIVSNV